MDSMDSETIHNTHLQATHYKSNMRSVLLMVNMDTKIKVALLSPERRERREFL